MTVTDLENKLDKLRKNSDAATAADAAWNWILDLQKLAGKDRTAAATELNDLFRLGQVPESLDGPTDGILVTTTTSGAVDPVVRAVTGLWMPWQGKKFDSATQTGNNRMTLSSAVPSKILWPLYKMRNDSGDRIAFDFETYTEAGKDDPDIQVMVIDYANIEDNPALVIRSIRDELVQLVPGAYLGKILFRTPRGNHELIGYFALRN